VFLFQNVIDVIDVIWADHVQRPIGDLISLTFPRCVIDVIDVIGTSPSADLPRRVPAVLAQPVIASTAGSVSETAA